MRVLFTPTFSGRQPGCSSSRSSLCTCHCPVILFLYSRYWPRRSSSDTPSLLFSPPDRPNKMMLKCLSILWSLRLALWPEIDTLQFFLEEKSLASTGIRTQYRAARSKYLSSTCVSRLSSCCGCVRACACVCVCTESRNDEGVILMASRSVMLPSSRQELVWVGWKTANR